MRIENFNDVLPANIAHIIEEKGLKQCRVAQKAGLKESEFYSMLGNRRIIKPCEIIPIANALGVEINDLFKID